MAKNAIFWSAMLAGTIVFAEATDAATIEAKSVSLSDVYAAVSSAKDGDTVKVPAGTATWTTTLNISNNITLRGAGADATIIVNEVQHTEGGAREEGATQPRAPMVRQGRGKARGMERMGRGQTPLILISVDKDVPFRMTGFTFRGGKPQARISANGEIRIRGNCHSFRIDHCTFDQLNGTNLGVSGFLWGVIDHCHFKLANQQPIHVSHESWNGGDHGNGSWADEPYWGSEKFVFIEDNVFDNQGKKKGVDAYEGARLVVRHNQFHNCGLSVHGTEGQGRGTKQVEEYDNTYKYDDPEPAGLIRSGSIITHDNKWINAGKGHVLQAYRQFHYSTHWGMADGQNRYDDNAPNEKTGYWETGKHTGSSGSTTLIDSSKHWAVNQWYVPGATFIVRNKTREGVNFNDREKLQTFALSNTSNTITCSGKSFTNIPLTFNTGDTYEIWKIIHSLDQPGLGKGDLLTGLPGLPAKWPRQVTEACYSWNNTKEGRPLDLSSAEPSIKEGRDFFNEMPKPGYKPYIYPHPLVTREQ